MKRFSVVLLVFWCLVASNPVWAQTIINLGGISNDGGAFANFGINDGSNNQMVAQRFSGINGTVVQVKVGLMKVGNPTDNAVISVRQGSPDGPMIGTSATVPGPSLSASTGSDHTLTVGPFAVWSSISYFVVYSRSGASDPRNFFNAVRGTNGSVFGGVTSGEGHFLKTGVGWISISLSNSFMLMVLGYTAPAPPAAPTGLAATVSGNQVALTWNPNSEPTLAYYKIYRSQTNGFIPSSSDSISRVNRPSTVFTDTGLALGTYYYRIAAVDSFNAVSAPSVQASAVVVSVVPPPAMGALAPSFSLDTVAVGSSAQKILAVTNTGGANLSLTSIAIGGTDALQFSISPASAAIAPGASQNLTVTFSPTSTGSKSALLTLIHNAAGSPTLVSLSGIGKLAPPPPILSVSVSSLTFGNVATRLPVVLKNTGTAALVISSVLSSVSDFSFSPNTFPVNIAAGDSLVAAVIFAPLSPEAKIGVITLRHNAAGGFTTIILAGNGAVPPLVPAPVINVSVSSLALATSVGSTSQKTFSVSNVTGTANLVISSIDIIGADAKEFSVDLSSVTVLPGTRQTLTVSFSPTTAGLKSAVVVIIHNASGGPAIILLSGNSNPLPQPSSSGWPDSATVDFRAVQTEGVGTLATRFVIDVKDPKLKLRGSGVEFDFGDGIKSTKGDFGPEHQYAPGRYTVILTMTAEDGRVIKITKTNYILVKDLPPSIDFTASPLSGVAPLTARFRARNSGGSVTSYRWDLGDTTITATADSLVHSYRKGGSYSITLTATGPGGTDTKTKNGHIVLSEPSPVSPADFDGNGQVGLDDYFLLIAAFGQSAVSSNEKFDLNRDGQIDLQDFFIFAEKFGK